MTKQKEAKIYKLTELVKQLHKDKYPQANEQKIKWYAKQRAIFPQRLNPKNLKSKYAYTDKDLQELRVLFTFMMFSPYEIAKDMLTIICAYMELAQLLSDPEYVAELKRAKSADITKEPWATYHQYISKVISEEIRLNKDQIWDKIQDGTEQIAQANQLLLKINRDFTNAKHILEHPEIEELFRIYEREQSKKANRPSASSG